MMDVSLKENALLCKTACCARVYAREERRRTGEGKDSALV